MLSWDVGFLGPGPSLDRSWIAGISMATAHGMDWGTQIAFPWGPLGFLRHPDLYYQGESVLGFLYLSAIHVALCLSLVWALRRRIHIALAALLAYIVVVQFPDVESAGLLTLIWCLAALDPEAPPWTRWVLVFGGAIVGPIELLVKLSGGILVLGACGITLLALDGRRRHLPAFAAASLVCFLALWFATGQGISNLDDFVRVSYEELSSYSQVMGGHEPGLAWQIPAAFLVAFVLFGAAFISYPARARRIGAVAVLAFTLFLYFKEGFVRQDWSHAARYFALAVGLAVVMPWPRARLILAAPAVVLLATLSILANTAGPLAYQSQVLDPVDNVRILNDQVDLLFSPSKREAVTEFGRLLMKQQYRLDPKTLALLRGHGVHVWPWEAGVVWAYGLDWEPLPSFQGYLAYSTPLDEQNADAIRSPERPERILMENTRVVDESHAGPSLDARYPAWDPPASNLAMLCHYAPLRTTRRWQVLAPAPHRCGPERSAGTVESSFGADFPVPRTPRGNILVARIHGAGVSGFERFEAFLYKARSRYAIFNGDPALQYRFVPGTATDGLLIGAAPGTDYPQPFALAPKVRRVELTKKGGSSDPLTIDFSTIRVRPLAPSSRLRADGSQPQRKR